MQCEMCGTEAALSSVKIEGTRLRVCKKCTKFGKVVMLPRQERKKKIRQEVSAPILIARYAQKIRKAREDKGMTQEAFARQLNEKTSIIHKIESSSFRPNIALAKKLEKLLNITLLEESKEEKVDIVVTKKTREFTIGDFIKPTQKHDKNRNS